MKSKPVFTILLTLALLLTGCGPAAPAPEEPASPPAEETPAEPTTDAPQMSPLTEENAPARRAYAAALSTLLDTNVLPDGSDNSDGYMGSIPDRETMAENRFSVFDVDGDGREELILLYTTAATAGQRGFVFDYDAETETLRTQLDEYPALTFHENGAVTADWSHNQGKGGDFWPYTLYTYDPDTDAYKKAGAVDAWDSRIAPEEYPTDVDVSNTGFVYYLYEDLAAEWDEIAPVDAAEYQAWLASHLGDAAPVEIPDLPLTAENIHGMQTPG